MSRLKEEEEFFFSISNTWHHDGTNSRNTATCGGTKRRRKSGPDRKVKRMRLCVLAKRHLPVSVDRPVVDASGERNSVAQMSLAIDPVFYNPGLDPAAHDPDSANYDPSSAAGYDPVIADCDPVPADYDPDRDNTCDIIIPEDPLTHIDSKTAQDPADCEPDLVETAIFSPNSEGQLIYSIETALNPANYDPIPPSDWETRFIGSIPADRTKGTVRRNITWSTKQRLSSSSHPSSKAGPVMGPRLSEEARLARTPVELWQLFFTDQMLDRIVEATNIKIAKFCAAKGLHNCSYKTKIPYVKPTDKIELKALIGLNYLFSLHGSESSKMKLFFGSDHPVFGATMSFHRHCFLTANLRLDKDQEAQSPEKFAVARELFELFNTTCATVVQSGSELCMEDALLPNNSLKTGMAAKKRPATSDWFLYKVLIDPSHSYTYHTHVHNRERLGVRTRCSGSRREVVLSLLHNAQLRGVDLTGRHLTCDRMAMSFELADRLAKEDCGMTCTGMLASKSKALPPPLLAPSRPVGDYIALFQAEPAAGAAAVSVHSWVMPEGEQGSTRHLVVATSSCPVILGRTKDDGKQVPAIIKRYEAAIQGSTRLSKMRKEWLWSRTNRWIAKPLSYMLDVARINARAVALLQQNDGEVPDMESFLENLGQELITPHMMRRRKKVQGPIQQKIHNFLGPDGLRSPIYFFTGTQQVVQVKENAASPKQRSAPTSTKQRVTAHPSTKQEAAASASNKQEASAPATTKQRALANPKQNAIVPASSKQRSIAARHKNSSAVNQLQVSSNHQLAAANYKYPCASSTGSHQQADAANPQLIACNHQNDAVTTDIQQLADASNQQPLAAKHQPAAANQQLITLNQRPTAANHRQNIGTNHKQNTGANQHQNNSANHQQNTDVELQQNTTVNCLKNTTTNHQQNTVANHQQEASKASNHYREAVTAPNHLLEAATAPNHLLEASTALSHHQEAATAANHHQESGTAANNHQEAVNADKRRKNGIAATSRRSGKDWPVPVVARCAHCYHLAANRAAAQKLGKVSFRCGVCKRHMCRKHLHQICLTCIPNAASCLAARNNTFWLSEPLDTSTIKQEVKWEEEEVLIKEEPKEKEEEEKVVEGTDDQLAPNSKNNKRRKRLARCNICQAACTNRKEVYKLSKIANTCSLCGLYTCRPHLRNACFDCDPTLLLLHEEEEESVEAKKLPAFSAQTDPLRIS